jgi:threonine/homoserine/homoserine lactone efflux protein
VFGLALAAPPGPMNAVIAEESVVRGWLSGFVAGLGAMSADALFCVATLLGVVGFLEGAPRVQGVVVGVGGVVMLYFAYDAATEASATFAGEGADPEGKGFRKAFVLALTNPYQILFWVTAGVGLLRAGEMDLLVHTPYVGERLAGVLVVATGGPALLAGFFGGIAVWITGFPAALVAADRRVEEFSGAVAVASAAVLAGFGLLFLYDAATTLDGVVAALL